MFVWGFPWGCDVSYNAPVEYKTFLQLLLSTTAEAAEDDLHLHVYNRVETGPGCLERESGPLNIVQSYTRNISHVCCLWHSYSCCALITHYSNKLMV